MTTHRSPRHPVQVVWWHPRDGWWGFRRPEPGWGMAKIYRWYLGLGPLEIRRWR